jgi:hypothetical protein
MDKLDAIFRTGFQTVEKTDTWLGIRRQDPGEERKPRDHEKPEEDGEFGEDHTTLSVAALHGFLHQLLQQAGAEDVAEEPSLIADINPELEPSQTPEDPRYRAAASAYQSTAQNMDRPSLNMSTTEQASSDAPRLALTAEELRTIHVMLDDVGVLAERNIPTITLRPAPTFLESLGNGVSEALGRAV